MPYFVLIPTLLVLSLLFPAYACNNSDDESSSDESSSFYDETIVHPSLKSLKDVQAFLKREDLHRVKSIHLGSNKNPFQLENRLFQQIARACPSLIELNLCKHPFSDLSFLKHFPSITILILSHSSATDFSPLSTLPKLEKLMLFNCSFFGDDQIPFIEHLKGSIQELIIGYNALTKEGVERLRQLFEDKLRRYMI